MLIESGPRLLLTHTARSISEAWDRLDFGALNVVHSSLALHAAFEMKI